MKLGINTTSCILWYIEGEREIRLFTMAVNFSAFLFFFAVWTLALSAGMRAKDFLYCSRQAGCQGPSIVRELIIPLCM